MTFMNRKKLLCTLAIPMLLCQVAKGQTISSRLLAQANASSDGATFHKTDSTVYNYLSNNRGGDLNTQLKFDVSTRWVFMDDTTMTNNMNTIQEFDTKNRLTSTVTQTWSGTAWVNSTKSLYFYDSTSGNLSSMIYQNWGGTAWNNISKDVYTYTSGTQLFSDSYMAWDGTSTFVPSYQTIYFYDVAGNKTQEIRQTYNSGTLSYDYSDRLMYTYTTSNLLLSSTYSTWSGSAWVNSFMISDAYDTSNNRISELYQLWNLSTMAWDNIMLHTYSNFTSAHLAQEDIQQNWTTDTSGSSWKNIMKTTNTYNSFSQLTSATGISWNIAGFWEHALNDPRATYYYGPYVIAAVTNIKNVGGDVKMYPVPAQNMLHLDLKWEEAQTADIAIFDVAGKVIVSYQTPEAAQYHSAIPVGNFADGVYIVKINGKNGQIVKQMVIAH